MKDTISESIEILVAKGNSFEDFDLVVTTLGKAICNRGRERIENAGHPVNHSLSTFTESFNATIISRINPVRESNLCGSSVFAIKDFQELLFVEMSGRQ